MENIMQKMIDLWEAGQTVVDPKLTTKIGADIQKQVGANRDPAKLDPKAAVNKAVTNAAVSDPAGVTQLLNDKKQMKKKMKKEHHLLTLEEFKATFRPHPEDEDGRVCKKCKKKRCTCPREND